MKLASLACLVGLFVLSGEVSSQQTPALFRILTSPPGPGSVVLYVTDTYVHPHLPGFDPRAGVLDRIVVDYDLMRATDFSIESTSTETRVMYQEHRIDPIFLTPGGILLSDFGAPLPPTTAVSPLVTVSMGDGVQDCAGTSRATFPSEPRARFRRTLTRSHPQFEDFLGGGQASTWAVSSFFLFEVGGLPLPRDWVPCGQPTTVLDRTRVTYSYWVFL